MPGTERQKPQICRQTIIIKKSLQYRYMAIMAVSVLVGFLIFAMEIGWSLSSVYKDHPTLLAPLFAQFGVLVPAFLLKIAIYFAVVLLLSSVLSHRMAGPVYKFEKGAEAVCDGDLTHRIFLRKGDQLLELQEALNTMVASLQDKVKTDRASAQSLAQELDKLAESEKDPELRRQLLDLSARAKTITASFTV